MNLIHINSLTDYPQLELFSSLTEAQLRQAIECNHGVFIAESPKVIKVALDSGYEPIAMLCEQKHIVGDAAEIIAQCGEIPIYTGSRDLLTNLTGYKLTRGVLCAMKRKPVPDIATICKNKSRVVVIDSVSDTTNIGAIFRSAAALGIDAVLLTRTSCDPLNRRSIRVSMGSVFLIPWTWIGDIQSELSPLGYKTAAMALTHDSITLDSPLLKSTPKLAIIMGTEGDGLPHEVIDASDYVVRIPMSNNVDSLNVAAASAVAFWEICKH